MTTAWNSSFLLRLPREKSRIPGLYHTNHEIPDFIYTLRVNVRIIVYMNLIWNSSQLSSLALEFQIFSETEKTPWGGGGGRFFLSETAQ